MFCQLKAEDVGHSGPELKELAHRILSLGGDKRMVIEATGGYHEHGIFVSGVNPLIIYVYMTAGANKFLRIYYARVKEYLAEQESQGTICP